MYTNRTSFTSRYPGLTEGLAVYSRDGERLGKIVQLSEDHLVVEKGLFFPQDFLIRYDDIQDLRDDSIYLNLAEGDLREWSDPSYSGWGQTEDINANRLEASPRDEYKDRYADWSSEKINVPVVEEELDVQKSSKQAGEVTIRKIVHTELRHFTVPVMREEVRVERVKPDGDMDSNRATTDAFEEKTINVPVMEEEITVTKRPVVKEEVRVSKERTTEEREIEGEVRKEEVRVEGDDKSKRIA